MSAAAPIIGGVISAIGSAAGGGKDKTKVSSGPADTLSKIAEGFATETSDIRQSLIGTFEKVLAGDAQSTGSVAPIIAKAVESSKRAGASTLRQTSDSLAGSGLTGTPFAEGIMATTRNDVNFNTSQVAPGIAQQILAMIPNFILGAGQNAVSGLSSSIAGSNTTRGGAKGASGNFSGQGFMDMFSALGSKS